MNRSDILSLPPSSSPRIIQADDTLVYYIIAAGAAGSSARKLVVAEESGRLMGYPAPIIATPGASYTLQAPVGTFLAGASVTYYVTPTAECSMSGGTLRTPSESLTIFPKTLTANKLYIIQITFSGSFWMLTSLVGGY